jgi:hypothetical protein
MKVSVFSYRGAPAAKRAKRAEEKSLISAVLPVLGLLALLTQTSASAQNLPIVQTTTNQSMAFGRYIAWLHARDLFTESGPVALAIDATLPGLDKQASLLAVREIDETERSEYLVLQREGDPVVFERVIAPYLVAQHEAEELPLSSIIIDPRNYKFRYIGEVEAGNNTAAYVFRIKPKKKRAGLIRGELWINSLTGAPFLVTGQLIEKPATSTRSVNIAREITSVDGCACARTTHMVIQTQPAGRAEITITELLLQSPDEPTGLPTTIGETKQSFSEMPLPRFR